MDITVTTANGTSSTSSADQFTYVAPPAPAVTSVSPDSGSTAGGAYVTIDGSGFVSGATGVNFGGVASNMIYVVNSGVLDAYAPAHAAGVVDITVTTANGTSSTSYADQFTYVPIATTTTLTSSANPSTFGQPIILTATVSNGGQETPTGQVTFEDGTTVLGTGTLSPAGQATLTTFSLTVGNHPISAIYGGDPFNAISISGVVNENVQPIQTTTSLSSSATTWSAGQTVTLTATVSATNDVPTGTVTFLSGATVLGTATLTPMPMGMQATLTTALPLLASQSVVADYGGDVADAASASNPLTLTYVPTTHYWINATGNGLASTVANWSGGPFGPGDSLVVDGTHLATSNTPITFNIAPTDANGNPLLATMQILSNYTQPIQFTQSPGFSNWFEDDSSTALVNVSGNVITAPSIDLAGALAVGGKLTSTGGPGVVYIGNNADLAGVTVTVGPGTNLSLSDSIFDVGSQLINYGQAMWSSGNVSLDNGSTIINAGDFQITGDQQTMNTVGGGAFENSGTLERTAYTGVLPPAAPSPTATMAVNFSNAPVAGFPGNPSVTVEAGALILNGSGEDAAPFTIDANALLQFHGGIQTLDSGTTFTGAGAFGVVDGNALDDTGVNISIATGTFVLEGATGILDGTPSPLIPFVVSTGTFTVAPTTTAFWLDGGALNDADVIVLGALTIGSSGLIIGPVTPVTMNNSYLWLDGVTTWTGPQDISMANSTVDNLGSFTAANAQKIVDANPPPPPPAPVLPPTSAFFNDGSFIKSAGTAATTISVPFDNAGSLSFNGTQINFDSTVEQTAAGAVTNLGGGTMTLTGVNLPGATNPTTFFLSAGELTGTAGATISGSLWNGGVVDFGTAFGILTVAGGYTQTANGTLTINIGGNGAIDSLHVSGQASLGGHLVVNGTQGTAAYDVLRAAGGFVNTFADVTAPWAAVYLTDDVWVQ